MGSNVHETENSVFHSGHSETIFFSSVVVSNTAQLGAACVLACFLGVLSEGLKFVVHGLKVATADSMPVTKATRCRIWLLGSAQTGVYLVWVSLTYCLMLLVMTRNVWICISILIGATLGHLLFHFQPLYTEVFRRRRLRKKSRDGRKTDDKSEGTTVSALGVQQEDIDLYPTDSITFDTRL